MTIDTASLARAQKVPDRRLDLYLYKRFVDAETCAALMALIDAGRRPSTITDDEGDASFRTSETCDLDMSVPVVHGLVHRIADLLGIDPASAEPMQGQRYAVGQEFKPHTDYFEATGIDYDRHCGVAGQRSWTAMIYLNVPDDGGATRFTAIDKIIRPEAGKLVCWRNLTANGRTNYDTIHQGMKVRRGAKYIVTQWFRERPWTG